MPYLTTNKKVHFEPLQLKWLSALTKQYTVSKENESLLSVSKHSIDVFQPLADLINHFTELQSQTWPL